MTQISPAFRDGGCPTRDSKSNGAGDMGAIVAWRGASGHDIVTTPTCPQPGFTLRRRRIVILHRLRCGQARCAESLYRWGVIASPACPCGEIHTTTRHIVEECPLTAFHGGLRRLHGAGLGAVEWLSRLSMKLWKFTNEEQHITFQDKYRPGAIDKLNVFMVNFYITLFGG